MNLKKRTISLTFLLFLVLMDNFAQTTEKFFDYAWNECPINEARFYRSITNTDSGYYCKDYFIKDAKIQMMGTFSDSLCQIKNGQFTDYYPNEIIKSSGRYIQNNKDGLWLTFHHNGFLKDSTVFSNGKQIGKSLSWYPNGFQCDSISLNEDGSGVSVTWFDNGAPSATGRYSAGMKQNGTWQYFHTNGNVSSIEIYDQSKLVSRQYFDEKGVQINDTTNTDRQTQFKGGEVAWFTFLSDKIYYPRGYKIINGDQAVVGVKFTVDEDGNVEDVFVYSPFDIVFDRMAVNAIKKSPKWLPAIRHNRRDKTTYYQPVRFKNNPE